MGIRGEQVQCQPISQPKDALGCAVDQLPVEGERPVDVTNQMLKLDNAAPGNVELDHGMLLRSHPGTDLLDVLRDPQSSNAAIIAFAYHPHKTYRPAAKS